MNDKFRFQKQWETYRRRRNLQYIVAVTGFVAPSLIFFALLRNGMVSSRATTLLVFMSIAAMIIMLIFVFHFQFWLCPNCEKRFFVRSFWVRFPEQLSNCSNCNLPKYANSTFEKKKN